MSEKKIILNDEEKAVIEKQIKGEFSFLSSSDEERKTLDNIIHKAESLLSELNAYDEIDDSLIEWYYNKYKAQE